MSHLEITPESFGRIVDTLSHRGPDDKGIYQDQNIGLGHRRLSILDTSVRGRQPMSTSDNKVWIVYNGEIYNFENLKKTLEEKGHLFLSTSDTEVLLHAYLEWETKCVNFLNGIFAFAIWDSRYNRLWLVRDHIGIKPLFFSEHKGTVYFASEVSTLLTFPDIPKDPDPFGIDAYFTFGYVPAPQTGYKHIKQLLPGQYLLFEQEAKKFREYWNLPLENPKIKLDEQDCVEEFDRLFTKVVSRQMVSDVPLGAFLSSGTDSFAVVRAMRKSNLKEISAFSIGFDDKRYNELPYTELAAKALGVSLISKCLSSDFNELLERINPHCSEPFADSSCLAVYLLSKLASEHVKVVLSGDGADELLGGYSVYKANNYADIYRKIPEFIRSEIIKPIAYWLPDIGGKYTLREKTRRFIYGAEKGKFRDHASWRTIISQELKKQIYTPEFWKEVKDFDPIDLYVEYLYHAKKRGASDFDCYLYADMRFYLPNDMLVKVDRMSMAHSLEVRVPFLDLEMIDFCWRLPQRLKIKNGKLKYIIRKSISDSYPASLQKLPKSGFNVAPPTNFKPDVNCKNSFYNLSNIDRLSFFSNYSKFLVKFNLCIFDYVQKKYKLSLNSY
jgi:asparagine synthase (glutamine-hydrolysing)